MKNITKNEFPLEDIGGMMTEPLGNYTSYNLRKMIKYCNEKNIEPEKLTEEELKIFEI